MTLRFAPDKLALLLSLVPYLDEVGVVSVAEAAAHFHVTETDIRAAVNLIAVSGIPTDGHNVFDNDMFDIDWGSFLEDDVIVLTRMVVIDDSPRFSSGEVSALIAGLQVLAGLPGSSENALLQGLIRKLAATAGDGHIIADPRPAEGIRTAIVRALSDGTQLAFSYTSSDGRFEARRVDPVQLSSENDLWYLHGWCHDRAALRMFRLDRMSDVLVTTLPVTFQPADVSVPETIFDEGSDDFEVTLEVSRAGVPLLGEFVRHAAVPKVGDPVRVNVRVAHAHGLKRLVLSHPTHIRVVAPQSAVGIVHDWATEALDASASGNSASSAG